MSSIEIERRVWLFTPAKRFALDLVWIVAILLLVACSEDQPGDEKDAGMETSGRRTGSAGKGSVAGLRPARVISEGLTAEL